MTGRGSDRFSYVVVRVTLERKSSERAWGGPARRWLTALLATGAGALALSGCEAEMPENLPRPPIPTTVSVFVSDGEVLVSPERIAVPGARPINITQNANAQLGQAREIEDATVDFRIANQIGRPVSLLIEGPARRLARLPGIGTTSFQMALPTGIYRLSSPAAGASTRLSVGPSRVSSGTSVLTP